jgi:integrase
MVSAALKQDSPSHASWQWPILVTGYDRSGSLSPIEHHVLVHDLAHALDRERTTSAVLASLHGIERLSVPLDDALAVTDSNGRYDDRIKLMVLKHCGLLGSAFWVWDASTWCRILGTSQKSFFAAHEPTPQCGGERQVLIAVAYLLRCFMNMPALGQVKRVALAKKIFGTQHIESVLQRIEAVITGWGYCSQCKPLKSLVAELLIINQHPELEALSPELLESVRVQWLDCNYRSSLYYRLARVLLALEIVSEEPRMRNRNDHELARQQRVDGIAPEWSATIERWEATSTLTPRSRVHTRGVILKAGRWLQVTHPDITCAEQWTRELAADYVAAISRMKVGDYVSRTSGLGKQIGKPISARTKSTYLSGMRCFFADLHAWEWVPRRFDPSRAFATPRSIKALIGPAPRTIADDLWAKLLWAGLNLDASDLPGHGGTPKAGCSAGSSFYPIEMLQALSLVWLFAGLRSDEIVRLRLGCVRQEPSPQPSSDTETYWLLDVPVHKTGTAMTKPIDPIVGEAIVAWEHVRPEQPTMHDAKTGETVRFLFSYRARTIPRDYLNQRLIPLLCGKAGIPCCDARGPISSHRARSTIASQLFNARQPMSLSELQAWLGHRSPATTQHYVAFTPTRLARAYTEADYFKRNLRMMDVLIDQDAIKSGATDAPWRYYDLGHGLCSYEFFDQCPHRMACARCDFYIPKQSSRADLLTSKSGMVHMLQEMPLTDEERKAVDGDAAAIDQLLERLSDKPAPEQTSNAKPSKT